MYILRDRHLPLLDVFLWLRGHVHVFLRTVADIRVRDTPLWIVSAFTAYSIEFTEPVCVMFFLTVLYFRMFSAGLT